MTKNVKLPGLRKKMKDCYAILGVRRDATASEIKRAYRQKAKLLHPDMEQGETEAFRELADAYQTLIDIKSRELFDESSSFKNFYGEAKKHGQYFDYRTWLKERDDDESRAKLIFFELLHSGEDEAVRLFKMMNMQRPGFRLSRWFTREEFMDWGFILTEELVMRREYYDAVLLLDQIIRMEYSYSYFKLFFPEVLALARHILRNNVAGTLSDELAIDCFEKALDLKLGKADDVFILTQMAECYRRIGDEVTADACRQEAQRLSSL